MSCPDKEVVIVQVGGSQSPQLRVSDFDCYEQPPSDGVFSDLLSETADGVQSMNGLTFNLTPNSDQLLSSIDLTLSLIFFGSSLINLTISGPGITTQTSSTEVITPGPPAVRRFTFASPVPIAALESYTITPSPFTNSFLQTTSAVIDAQFLPNGVPSFGSIAGLNGLPSTDSTVYNVFTAEDGVNYAFEDETQNEVDISGGIPSDWIICPPSRVSDDAGNTFVRSTSDGGDYSMPITEIDCYRDPIISTINTLTGNGVARLFSGVEGLRFTPSQNVLLTSVTMKAQLVGGASSAGSGLTLRDGPLLTSPPITVNSQSVPGTTGADNVTWQYPSIELTAGNTYTFTHDDAVDFNYFVDADLNSQISNTADSLDPEVIIAFNLPGSYVKYNVITYSDGAQSKVIASELGNPTNIVDVTAAIPGTWQLLSVDELNGSLINNSDLPSFPDFATASTVLAVPANLGKTALYFNSTTNAIEGVRQ